MRSEHETDPLPEATYDRLRTNGHFEIPPATLARLALSAAAATAADNARGLVPTRADGYASSAELVGHAASLVADAQEVLDRAVVAERARGVSWAEIGEVLGGVSRQAAQERFRVRITEWEKGLDRPYIPSPGGRILNPQLPEAALSPRTVARRLDAWVTRHTEPADPDHGDRPVSAALDATRNRALALSAAVLATSRRLLDASIIRPGHPTTERILTERKIACYEAILVDKPGDVATLELLAGARTRLSELHAVSDTTDRQPSVIAEDSPER